MQEKPLEYLILHRHIGDDKGVSDNKGHGHIGDLPVEGMSQEQMAFTSLVIKVLQHFRIIEDKAFFDVITVGGEQLKGLDEIIDKIPVEFFLYADKLCGCFLR